MLDALCTFAEETGFYAYRMTEIQNGVSTTRTLRPSNPCNNSYSVSKAFTMTAIGMLCDRGLLTVDTHICDLFRAELPEGYDENWENVTVDHVLRHSYGADAGFLDIDVEDIHAYPTDDFLRIVLSHRLPLAVDSKWVYTDAAYYLLSRVVSKVTGEKLDDFLWRELFYPLGFQEAAWSTCPHGYPMGATGLYIRTEDMAKLGQLYLQQGLWNGKRLLSAEWVAIALERAYEFSRPVPGLYGKGGMCGQMLCVIPEQNRVFAWHAYDDSERAGRFFHRVCELAEFHKQ